MPKKKPSLLWQKEVEKIGGKALVEAINELHVTQREILKQLGDMHKRQTTSEIRTDGLYKAFPAGDIDGHARYHDSLIKANEERRQLYKAIIEKTLTGLIWLLVIYIGSVVVRETGHFFSLFQSAPQVSQ